MTSEYTKPRRGQLRPIADNSADIEASGRRDIALTANNFEANVKSNLPTFERFRLEHQKGKINRQALTHAYQAASEAAIEVYDHRLSLLKQRAKAEQHVENEAIIRELHVGIAASTDQLLDHYHKARHRMTVEAAKTLTTNRNELEDMLNRGEIDQDAYDFLQSTVSQDFGSRVSRSRDLSEQFVDDLTEKVQSILHRRRDSDGNW